MLKKNHIEKLLDEKKAQLETLEIEIEALSKLINETKENQPLINKKGLGTTSIEYVRDFNAIVAFGGLMITATFFSFKDSKYVEFIIIVVLAFASAPYCFLVLKIWESCKKKNWLNFVVVSGVAIVIWLICIVLAFYAITKINL